MFAAIMYLTDEVLCTLHVHLSVEPGISEKGGGVRARVLQGSRARGLLSSLITAQVTYLWVCTLLVKFATA